MLHGLILAGGKGIRLYPLSREDNPKQFLKLVNGKSLLRNTFNRLTPAIDKENIYIVTNKNYVEKIFNELPEINKENVFSEPSNKETAACIALSAIKLLKKDKDALLAVLPSDHFIEAEENFRATLFNAAAIAEDKRCIVTFGIVPKAPETGYGYIEMEEKNDDNASVNGSLYKIKRFTEKPNLEVAKDFLLKGTYLWNSGIFLFRADIYLHEMEKYLPEMYRSIMKIYENLGNEDEKEIIEEQYKMIDGISIDFGIMQKTRKAYVIKADFDWNDIGSFTALFSFITEKDNNKILGNAFLNESTNCSIISDKRLIIGFGVKDIIVIDTGDVLLIMEKGRDQEIKFLVNKLKQNIETKSYV